jgi:protein SDA1
MRGKEVVPASLILPVFFKLFKCKDKELRKFLHSIIISDLKKINIAHKNHGINKKL